MKVNKWFLGFFLIMYPVLFYAKVWKQPDIYLIAVPLFVGAMFLQSVLSWKKLSGKKPYLPIAFAFVLCGDVFINFLTNAQWSILPFSLGHIFFSLHFISEAPKFQKRVTCFILPLIISVVAFVALNLRIDNTQMRIASILYLLLLAFMFGNALGYLKSSLNKAKIFTTVFGAGCFYFTDIMVCTLLVYHGIIFSIIVWILYPPALYLLSISDNGDY